MGTSAELQYAFDSVIRLHKNVMADHPSRHSVTYFESRLTDLAVDWAAIRKLSVKMFKDIKGDELVEFKQTLDSVTSIYYELKDTLEQGLRIEQTKTVSTNPNLSLTEFKEVSTGQKLKLPTIEIPKFSGKFETWSQFQSIYVSLIHTNMSLSDTEKFHYLKNALVGDASNLIQHLNFSANNYNTAWELLLKRYQNHRLLINTFLRALISQPAMDDSAKSIETFVNTTQESLANLATLSLHVDHWDAILVYICETKMSSEIRSHWELELRGDTGTPTMSQLKQFLNQRVQILEASGSSKGTRSGDSKVRRSYAAQETTARPKCPKCSASHFLFKCDSFLSMGSNKRSECAKRLKVCFNCLHGGHSISQCKSLSRCRKCSKSHHTLLHFESPKYTKEEAAKTVSDGFNDQNKHASTASALNESVVSACARDTFIISLLPTAKVIVQNNGRQVIVRALIDQGSQRSFMSERIARQLKIKRTRVHIKIQGIGDKSRIIHWESEVSVHSAHDTNENVIIRALIMDSIVDDLPTSRVAPVRWEHIQGIRLADPTYDTPGRIDLLLGANEVSRIIRPGLIPGNDNCPMAQETIFGWILSGGTESIQATSGAKSSSRTMTIVETNNLDESLRRFWEIEEIAPARRPRSKEEQECEDYYAATFKRTAEGRFIVSLPLKQPPSVLGESKEHAKRRFFQLERKLSKNELLKREYQAIIHEYLEQQHMEIVPAHQLNHRSYYLPHHAVFKESSDTTKIRVVFDASSATTSGLSLNEIMKVGPVIQRDLYSLLLRWRTYRYVVSADIRGMYRQIWIDERQRDLQRILWRENTDQPLQIYRLKTVTFGTAAAPYLATRTLNQLAQDEAQRYPKGSKMILENFSVDDFLGGAETLHECRDITYEVLQLLREAGFDIRKWLSNDRDVLDGLTDILKQRNFDEMWLKSDNKEVRTLGIDWDPKADVFKFTSCIAEYDGSKPLTKRIIASEAAKLFEPLGWLSPVVIVAKVFLQRLWLQHLDWDEEVSQHIARQWRKFRLGLKDCISIQIPRWINYSTSAVNIQLHAFADSSEAAYAACVYLRVQRDTTIQTSLLTAKTRVAPLKKISLPRLELCAASLLSKLVNKVVESLDIHMDEIHAWSDSTIVLSWLQQPPHLWKTYVANRVSEIRANTFITKWHHVPTKMNPADLATRGTTASDLVTSGLWWFGPPWLKEPVEQWPMSPRTLCTELEKRKLDTLALSTTAFENTLLNRYSTLQRLLTTTAWCRRWKYRSQGGSITAHELQEAEITWVRLIQDAHYNSEVATLSKKNQLPANNSLIHLSPFIDNDGILRVGGRLKNSLLPYDQKHNIILPRDSYFTKLIIQRAHKEVLHGGTQLVLACLRHKYWIVRGRSLVKSELSKCIQCCRYRQAGVNQLMGDLPSQRVVPSKPFQCVGIDYAGPIPVRRNKGRGATIIKGYIALFVCFATKAIHLELVSDLTSEGLVGAIRRFISRRGRCLDIYSDNGTNMIGAAKQLIDFINQVKQQHSTIAESLRHDQITWHFIPPRAPHFGGLWESAVKSVKYHLKRVMDNSTFTIEELTTLLCQIEACVNSRPLCKLSDDPQDSNVLTPNHFLIGNSTVLIPDNAPFSKTSLLNRWNLVQNKLHQFWSIWSKEYLHTLNNRNRWTKVQPNIKIGQVVLIKDELLPPAEWKKGVIIEVFPGKDQHVRVVSIKTAKTILTRPLTKIVPLPVQHEVPVTENMTPDTSNPANDQQVSRTYKITSNKGFSWWWLLLTCVSILFTSGVCHVSQPYNLTKFSQNTGMFYERIANVKLISGHWTIVNYFNGSNMNLAYGRLQAAITSLEKICEQIPEYQSHCRLRNQHFQQSLDELNQRNMLIDTHHRQLHQRVKRGWINGVGKIANTLFGVLDNDFAEKYHEDIKRIEAENDHNHAIISNMTTIIDMSMNSFKAQDEKLSTIIGTINAEIDQLRRAANDITKEADIKSRYSAWLSQITFQLWEMHRFQDMLFGNIIDVQHGVLNTYLLPVPVLKEQLSLIHNRLGFGNQILFTNDLRWVDLYKTIECKVGVRETLIIFELRVPIVDSETFEAYKIVPLPTIVNNSELYVNTGLKYLAFNSRRDRYVGLNDELKSRCHTLDDQWLCDINSPIFNLESLNLRCEVNTFLRQSLDVRHCVLLSTQVKPHWIELQTPNNWVYVLNDPYRINIKCIHHSNTFSVDLVGEGMLSIEAGCTIQHRSFILRSKKELQSTLPGLDSVLFPQWDAQDPVNHPLEIIPMQHANLSWTKQDVGNITAAIEDLKREQRYPHLHLSKQDDVQNATIGVLGLIIVIIISFLIFKCTAKICKKYKPRIPTIETETQA